MSMIKSKN